ncbi:MAG: GatB/YqeY domain-containing protein [Candidatus Syntrophonatronum acetioxidans]|uniref:GatB/YqeY domain-containing protein n=1 Tax=Candidatus Syntrophonatronum acetioxidans TaxID=1795816 RepID=A0A424YCA7_9FIRM|nr:MAG: GatB/YqeY domain-containing protein [Candidatus Syntrophonatronum acetioxidans]
MALNEKLNEDMKAAMKAKDKFKLSVLRMIRSEIKNEEINKKGQLNDEEIIEVLSRELKKRREALEEYKKAQRDDIVQDLNKEIELLLSYMPEQLGEEEIERLAKEAIEETGAETKKDIGKVMGVLMPRLKGKADGKLVNKIVQKYLE